LKIFLLAILTVFVGCLKANEEQGIGDINPALSFHHSASEQVSSAYILDVVNWEQDGNGLNIFRHLIEDDYFGLEIATSGAVISDLKVQMSKSTSDFVNFLGLDGSFGAQSLDIKLPFSLFSGGGLFLTNDQADYNPNEFEYSFIPAASDIEVAANYVIDSATNQVTVTIEEKGSIVVRKITTPADLLVINEPAPYALRVYHDLEPALRTFTWNNPDGTATCSLDGGANWNPCSSDDSLILTAEEFMTYPDVRVRVEDAAGVSEGRIDLSDSDNGYSHVSIFTCDHVLNPASFTDGLKDLLSHGTDGDVFCLDAGTYTVGVSPADKIDLNNIASLFLIGDHNNSAEINSNNSNVIDIWATSVSNPKYVFANLNINLNSAPSVAFQTYFSGSSDGNNPASAVLSNVTINQTTASNTKAVFIDKGFSVEIYNSQISCSSGSGVVVENSDIVMKDSTITMTGAGEVALAFHGAYAATEPSYIVDSSISTQSTTLPAIEMGNTSNTDVSDLVINNSKVSSVFYGLVFDGAMSYELIVENSTFNRLDISGGDDTAIYANPSVNFNLSGTNNSFCAENAGTHKFDNGFETGLAGGANSTPGLFSITETAICPL
jgi:hypothetical protein